MAKAEGAGAGDHRGVICAVLHFGHNRRAKESERFPFGGEPAAEAGIRGDAPYDRERFTAVLTNGEGDLREERIDDCFLSGRAEIGKSLLKFAFFPKFFGL